MSTRGTGRLVLGLMSGTSHDGIDAALVRVWPGRPEFLRHCHFPYRASLRNSIAAAFEGTTADICRLDFALGEAFGEAALKCMKKARIARSRLSAVASHGQTLCHLPPNKKGAKGATLQVGAPAVIARMTGVQVVSDFRPADMAAGGQGAPLVPLADWLMFRHKAPCAVQNIGGIANVTVVTRDASRVAAFDTGPGGGLMDEAMRTLFGRNMDRGGRTARKGVPDERLLKKLLSHPFFIKRPPKSTGRETFGPSFLAEALGPHRPGRPEDFIATLTHLTARSIAGAYERFVLPRHKIKEVILTGGGARNVYLVGLLREALFPLEVTLIEEYGIPAGAKEAMSFALLANETLRGRPGNLPGATGAKRRVVLGSITPPP